MQEYKKHTAGCMLEIFNVIKDFKPANYRCSSNYDKDGLISKKTLERIFHIDDLFNCNLELGNNYNNHLIAVYTKHLIQICRIKKIKSKNRHIHYEYNPNYKEDFANQKVPDEMEQLLKELEELNTLHAK